MLKIWQRYFYKDIASTFFLFLFTFYGLYVLIDYATHASSFHHQHSRYQFQEIALLYLMEFSQRSEVLVPFALLLATIKTLCKLNVQNELVALLVGGIKLKTLLRPFLISALVCVGLLYLNQEFFLPAAMRKLKILDDAKSRQKAKAAKQAAVQHLVLEDGSTLLFQNYDAAKQRFFDAYWIRSADSIYRMKFLYPQESQPVGYEVSELIRNDRQALVAGPLLNSLVFPSMQFNKEVLLETITPPDELSLSDLTNKLPAQVQVQNEKQARVYSNLLFKLFMPWLCVFAVLGPIPYCIRFSRTLPIFFIYACSIFGLVSVYLILDATLILGERNVFAPLLIMGVPFAAIGAFLAFRYWRIGCSN